MLRLQHRCLRCLPGIGFTRSEGELDGVKSGVYRLTVRGMYLCAGSASGTIHFYKMLTQTKNPLTKEVEAPVNSSSSSNNGRTGYIASYISSFMPENLDTTRSFAQVRLRMYTS